MSADSRFQRVPVGSRFDGQKGPNGCQLCRQCGTECDSKRKTFCGPKCVEAWRVERWPSEQRKLVLERDRGVCALCGLDCLALDRELNELGRTNRATFDARVAELGLEKRTWSGMVTRSLWEMDHTIPVVEGGGSCGLENLRTLCWKDHRRETAALAKRRAERRRANGGAK